MLALLPLLALSAGLPVKSLDSLLDEASRTRGGTATAAVVRVRDGAVLWEHDGWRRMLPASTQKVLAAAALRELLGKDRTLPTRLLRPGHQPISGSTLPGNLIIEGGGDPALARGSDSAALDLLARGLRARGIRKVRGQLVLRDPLLKPADPLWPDSWDWANSLSDCDGAPSTGLSVDGNCPGDISQPRPYRSVAKAFRAALVRQGISVGGSDRIEPGTSSPASDSVLAVHASAPLDSLLRQALWKSSNHDMETFGLVAGRGDANSSRQAGLLRVRKVLASLGLDTLQNNLVDQCGLSRKNMLSAEAMAKVLARIARSPSLDIFPLLPSPGEGTLKTRFKRTLPEGCELRAKTGSLDGTSALVGRLVPPQGDTLVFVLFFQGYAGPAAPIRFAQDQIVGLLAGGSVVAPLPSDTAAAPPRPPKPLRPRNALQEP